jgi:hypothetical protein
MADEEQERENFHPNTALTLLKKELGDCPGEHSVEVHSFSLPPEGLSPANDL